MDEDETRLMQIIDMHTAGEPVRIIDARHLDLVGESLLERRAHFEARFDHIRRAAMMEPRGHADMYGVVLIKSCRSYARLGAIFIHNSGYSSMCGHVCLALGRFLSDECGTDARDSFIVETPCGPVTIRHDRLAQPYSSASVIEVPGEVLFRDLELNIGEQGSVRFEICYGGAYYAVLSAADLGIDFTSTSTEEIRRLLTALVAEARNRISIPVNGPRELAYLYGAILTEHDELSPTAINRHICWFGSGQIDRSPTGSGVAARLALAFQKKEADIGLPYTFQGVSGLAFSGSIRTASEGKVLTEMSGASFYTGKGAMVIERDDPIAHGFLPDHLRSV